MRWFPALACSLLLCSCGSSSGGDDTQHTDAASAEDLLLSDAETPGDTSHATDGLVEIEDKPMDALLDLGEIGDLSEAPDAPLDLEPEDLGPPPVVSDSFKTHGTIKQIYVWGAEPEVEIEVVSPDGEVVFADVTDYQGSRVARELAPGKGYVVRLADDHEDYADSIHVLSLEDSWPKESFYSKQKLKQGYQYIEMRDGILLSAWISLPGPPEDGPYPTLVNYSGYSPSSPGKSVGADVEFMCVLYPILCEAPNFPSGLIAGIMGYAVVGVNMRGTGCSGGAYDYFETLQLTDGYDVIETVAHQSWVKHHKVGMVGLSYPGISQLFVAAQTPPSLAAIAPFSVIANTTSTLVPGGILNDGFALDWIEHVLNKSDPYAHGWITKLVEEGDTICEAHQLLHSQKVDVIQKAYDNPFYTDDVAAPVDPSTFVHQIDVPVFLVGQTQDEQTGPHFPSLFSRFTNAPVTRFSMTNGVHPDGFSPQILAEWFNFLAFYVDREIPTVPEEFYLMVPVFMEDVFGAKLELPESRFEDFTDFDDALSFYEGEPDVRVIFESGTAPDITAGAPQGAFEEHFEKWPVPATQIIRWYFHPDGSLQQLAPPDGDSASTFVHDSAAGNRVTLVGGGIDKPQPTWDWRQPATSEAISFVSAPLTKDHVFVGHASGDLWVKSTADDADLEICITEVRPDGKESYIMCGWLRASHRTLLEGSTELQPLNSHYKEDLIALDGEKWNLVRIEMMPFSHVFRADSRIRIIVDTPGDSMARWRFNLLEFESNPTHSIAHHGEHPSSVALPLIPAINVPTELAPCNALRGQPCRDYQPFENAL
jgi:uncharacterized protein